MCKCMRIHGCIIEPRLNLLPGDVTERQRTARNTDTLDVSMFPYPILHAYWVNVTKKSKILSYICD